MKSPADTTTIIVVASISHIRSATGLSIGIRAFFALDWGPVADRKSETDGPEVVSANSPLMTQALPA